MKHCEGCMECARCGRCSDDPRKFFIAEEWKHGPVKLSEFSLCRDCSAKTLLISGKGGERYGRCPKFRVVTVKPGS